MKAIETTYGGVKFRSRLEARWAVFFDALGLTWEYEPEAFVLSDGSSYLPDFRVNGMAGGAIDGAFTFVEVKPIDGIEGVEKARRFTDEAYREHGHNLFMVRGAPATDGHSAYPFTFSDEAFRSAVAKARAHRFWNPGA